jgi:AcrR family transcriptional regulator
MPLIVDKDAIRMEILMAFQRCIDRKPLTNVSLRDIAAEAGMSHAKLLNYFDSKEDLLVSYVRYTRDYMSRKCVEWFQEHDRADYGSNSEYMNAFMSYVARGKVGEKRPNATTQTYVLAHYNERVAELVKEEFAEWRRIMELCLKKIYGEEVGAREAEGMMILIAGTFICNYNNALTGNISDDIIGSFNMLLQS